MSYQIIAEKPIGEVITDQGAYMQMKLMHIVCDTISQIPEPLPAWATGSRCDVTADGGAVYMLNNARNWEKVNFFGNAGGDSGTTDYSELTNKPQINGVTLSGNKTAADLNLETDLSDYYTKQQTDSKITEKVAEIVADAPEDFDTLKEMSDWIENHEESAAAMNSAIQGKVDKETGKGLSTNDYTTAEKTKLAGLPASLIVYDNTIMSENKYVEVPSGSAIGTTITGALPFTLSPGDVIFINVGEGENDHIIPPFMLTWGSNVQIYVAVNSVDDFSVVGYIKIWLYDASHFRVKVLKQATTSIVWVNVSRLKIK